MQKSRKHTDSKEENMQKSNKGNTKRKYIAPRLSKLADGLKNTEFFGFDAGTGGS